MILFGVFKSSTEYSLNKDPRCNLKDRVIRHLLSMHRFEYTYNGRHNGCCPCTCTLCCSRIKVHKKQYSQMLKLHSSLKETAEILQML